MKVQLRHQIAQCSDVELLTRKGLHHEFTCKAGLFQQTVAIPGYQLKDLAHTRSPGHEDHPGIAAVIQQQYLRQPQVAKQVTITGELGMQAEFVQT